MPERNDAEKASSSSNLNVRVELGGLGLLKADTDDQRSPEAADASSNCVPRCRAMSADNLRRSTPPFRV